MLWGSPPGPAGQADEGVGCGPGGPPHNDSGTYAHPNARSQPRRLIGVMPQSVRRYLPLALVSFLSVYLELIVIRWLASEVRIFAYFKNFPLMAAFLGAGVGCLLAQRRRDYFRHAPLLLFILAAVISFAYRGGYTYITFVDPYEHYLLGSFRFDHPLFQMLKG